MGRTWAWAWIADAVARAAATVAEQDSDEAIEREQPAACHPSSDPRPWS